MDGSDIDADGRVEHARNARTSPSMGLPPKRVCSGAMDVNASTTTAAADVVMTAESVSFFILLLMG